MKQTPSSEMAISYCKHGYFSRNCKLLSKMITDFTSPPVTCEGSSFCTSWSAPGGICPHASRWSGISCSLNVNLPHDQGPCVILNPPTRLYWRVQLNYVPVFHPGCFLLTELGKIIIYSGMYDLQVLCLYFHFLNSIFWKAKFLKLCYSTYQAAVVSCLFQVSSKKYLRIPKSQKFSFRNCIFIGTFRFVMYLYNMFLGRDKTSS